MMTCKWNNVSRRCACFCFSILKGLFEKLFCSVGQCAIFKTPFYFCLFLLLSRHFEIPGVVFETILLKIVLKIFQADLFYSIKDWLFVVLAGLKQMMIKGRWRIIIPQHDHVFVRIICWFSLSLTRVELWNHELDIDETVPAFISKQLPGSASLYNSFGLSWWMNTS